MATCGCRLSGHLMRPARPHGSARRGDPAGRCWPNLVAQAAQFHPGCGGSPRSGSPWPTAAPDREAPAPRLDDHAGVASSSSVGPDLDAARPAPPGQPSPPAAGSPAAAAPQPRAAAPAAPRCWRPSSAPAAPAIPAAGGRSDRAVVAPPIDHLCQPLAQRSRSSEPAADILAPTGSQAVARPSRRLESRPVPQLPCHHGRRGRTWIRGSGPTSRTRIQALVAGPAPFTVAFAGIAAARYRPIPTGR